MRLSGRSHDSPLFYLLVLAYMAILGAWYLGQAPGAFPAGGLLEGSLVALRLVIELVAAFYVISTLLKCLDYLGAAAPAPPAARVAQGPPPRVGVIYLCCDDFDAEAFSSLCELEHDGPIEILAHDDGRGDHATIESRLRAIASRHGRPVTVLRRPRREGGKAGAVNYLLAQAGGRFDYLLLCDSDSTALDPRAIPKGLGYFEDPEVAAVQFRGRGLAAPEEPPLQRRLARAIDVFDLFASHQSRHGMMPFLGHNALVRASALVEEGGLTPGFLSDDIDITVRWYLSGRRVAYAREVEFAERAPGSYAAFRLRARKWAAGCAQVIRRHGLRVLLSGRLPLGRRLGFLEFVGFYAAQVLLVGYLINAHILIPMLAPRRDAVADPVGIGALAGAAVLAAIFLPTLAFCVKERRLAEWPALAWTCCLVYGSASIETCRGILAGLARRSLRWIPTNGGFRDGSLTARCWTEFALGAALFLVPLARMRELLAMPVSYLFVANYLLSPVILACYQEPRRGGRARRPLQAGALPLVLLCLLLALSDACSGSATAVAGQVRAEGDRVLVDGRPFLLKGIHYSPWLPGTGPAKDHAWPDGSTVARDLDMIRGANANAILVYDDAPAAVFDQAADRGLMVLQAFTINWQSIHDDAYAERRASQVLARVGEVKGRPNLLAWILGNEVTEWVYEQRGAGLIASRLAALARQVRQADPDHPITHANWPITKELSLPFLDIVSFNVYPLWPREVVVRGYEEYLRDVLKPLAGGRPLWITEFGTNSLESTPDQQAGELRRCWEAIRAQTSGGVVFSFADEWWKNYDNPVERGKYWERAYAPDDERAHDLDPEEYYGIVDDRRAPKPAYEAVKRMYGGGRIPAAVYFVAPLVLLTVYTLYIFTKRP